MTSQPPYFIRTQHGPIDIDIFLYDIVQIIRVLFSQHSTQNVGCFRAKVGQFCVTVYDTVIMIRWKPV